MRRTYFFFVLGYILNFKNQSNPVAFLFERPKSISTYSKDFYTRESSDPFRILLEFSICILIIKLLVFEGPWIAVIPALIATLGFVYIAYTHVMIYIFNRVPVLSSDIEFLKVGMTIAYKRKLLLSVGLLLLLAGVFYAYFEISTLLFGLETSPTLLIGALLLFSFLGLFNVYKYGYHLLQDRTVHSFLIYFLLNLKNGRKYNFLLKKDKSFFEKFNLYKDLKLEKRPNVVIFSIESYGSIVLKDAELKKSIDTIYERYSESLKKENFLIRSKLSKPPQFGGGSWLSYTSFIFGMKVDDMNQYNLLFKSNSSFQYYQSLLSFFKSNGYKNYLLCPLGGGYNDKVDWSLVKKNFSSDEFLDWERMDYQGKRYQYLKFGYSPSDQYSLHKADEIIREAETEPYSLFFSTLNSHVPFDSPQEIVDNWQDLKIQTDESSQLEEENSNLFSRYKKAIVYQLSFVLDYILKNGGDDTIYILFGDHQPPFITKKEMGFTTPIHIIAKNKDFVRAFEEISFIEGFYPKMAESESMNHEGFYSIFMKAFNRTYGKLKDIDLPYLHNGVQLNEE